MRQKLITTLATFALVTCTLAYTPSRADAGVFFSRGWGNRGLAVEVSPAYGPTYDYYSSPYYSASYYTPTYTYPSAAYVAPIYTGYGQPLYSTAPSFSFYYGGREPYYRGYYGGRRAVLPQQPLAVMGPDVVPKLSEPAHFDAPARCVSPSRTLQAW